jgi:hypothetical protein
LNTRRTEKKTIGSTNKVLQTCARHVQQPANTLPTRSCAKRVCLPRVCAEWVGQLSKGCGSYVFFHALKRMCFKG